MNALTSAFTQFVPSRDAWVYACGVGPRFLHATRFDSPDDAVSSRKAALFGALRQGRRFRTHVQSKYVMARMNGSHIASRNRMRRQGVEDINGKVPLFAEPPKKPRRKLSKAELRQRAAAAFLAWREGQTSKAK